MRNKIKTMKNREQIVKGIHHKENAKKRDFFFFQMTSKFSNQISLAHAKVYYKSATESEDLDEVAENGER